MTTDKRVEVVVLTTQSQVSYRLLRQSLTDPRVSCQLVAILPGSGTGSLAQVLRKVWGKSGFRVVAYKAVTHLATVIQSWRARLAKGGLEATPRGLAEHLGIPTIDFADCNDPSLLRLLEGLAPDVLISVNVYQRIQEPLLSLPSKSALNTHFGMLPKYKGMSPVIWAMAEGESHIGLTVHQMVLDFDEGAIVRQVPLELRESDSVLSVTLRGATLASGLLLESVLISAKTPGVGEPQVGAESYHSLPDKEAIRSLRSRGRSLWRLRDLLELMSHQRVESGSGRNL